MNLKKTFREITSITLIILSVLAFRSTFFEPFKIPSGSMIPTLLIGDFILVNKFSYGFKVPFSDWFTDPIYITGSEKPQRGDVVVFKYPKDTSLNYIKRVIALPGEYVEVKDGVVYVNDQAIDAKQIDGQKIMEDMDEKFKMYNFKFEETKTGEISHIIQHNMDSFYSSDYYRTQVPEGHYFVMGDNRDFSADSRRWGFVPFSYIKGKAVMIWFSFNFKWPFVESDDTFSYRPWRIGSLIL